MAGLQLAIDILARDRASAVLHKVGGEAEKTGGKFGNLKTAGAAGLAGVAAAAVAFGKSSVDAYQNVGKETLKLQRYIGGTAEDASRLRFAAEETGVSMDDFTKGIGKFEKFTVAAGSQFTDFETKIKDAAAQHKTMNGHLGSSATVFAKMGVAVKDAQGNLKPMGKLIPELAEEFKKMPNGAEKSAYAMQLFGKGGMAMLPFLNKGADGVKELMQQSDKLGNTLSGKDLQAVKDNTKAKREWHATIQGLQIQLGRYLFPALTSIGEIMVKVSGFVEKNGAVMKPVILVVAALVAGFKAWSIGLAVFNAVMAANPIALVVIGVAALAAGLIYAYKHSETFRKIVDGAFKAVGSAFSAAWGLIKAGFGWLKSNWPYVLGILVGPFGLAAAYIYKHWDAVVGFVKGIPGKLAAGAKGMWNFLKDGLRSTLNWIVDQLNQLHFTIGGGSFMGVGIPSVTIGISGLHHFATGTQSASAGFALVGEQGPEIVRFGGGEQVSTAGDTARMLRGGRSGGGDTYNVYASSTAQGSDIVTALRRFKQESGGGELGIA